jgi:hypothetical protein
MREPAVEPEIGYVAKSGGPCPRPTCDGVLGVGRSGVKYESKTEKRVLQYLYCQKCGCRPINNKVTVRMYFPVYEGQK